MKANQFAARIQAIAAFFFALLVIPPAEGRGQEWQNDIQFALAADSASNEADRFSESDDGEFSAECCPHPCQPYPYSPSADFLACVAACQKSMAQQGITYDALATQFYQGVAGGGNEQEFEYGGKVDQFFIFDSTKLGLWEGMTMTMHAETRFGDDVNREAVGLAPVNVAMLYPKLDEHDTAITGLSFAQALDEETLATFGKFNALDLFQMLYPETGRGIDGFMNASMVIPISVARVVPLSFLGAGALKLQGKQVQGGILVFDTHNIPTTSGFDELFDNGANILGFWRFFTDVDGLPGSHMFGGIWSTGEFTSFDPTGFVIVPGQGIVANKQSGAYTLIYVLEQTLWMDGCNPQKKITLLSQWGLANEETSPFGWSANVGIQGRGFNRSRPQDSFGLGYFHSGLSDDFKTLLAPLINLQDINGVELYYNAAVTECFHLTADFQVIEPAEVANDTALVVGLRATIGL